MSKLTPESPRLFRPTLAAWIGLNESIFLEQLNFILTEVENKGKFADGKKWYRDTPRAFMIQYFPFWDESIVKRTIANLRADALIQVRSDLNEDHRDRSLWYTINYPALERLDGPVARITGKSDKRKEARKARKSKPDNYPDYTKVQNVPLSDEAGTNSTSDNQQNVLLPQVQNVPTPKESLILKEPKTKEKIPPKGVGKPTKRESKNPHLSRQMFAALAKVCKIDLTVLTGKTRGELNQNECALRNGDVNPDALPDFESWWYANDWRGKKGQPPEPSQVIDAWGQFKGWQKEQRQEATTWNLPPDQIPVSPPTPDEDIWQRAKDILRTKMLKATYDTVIEGTSLSRKNGHYVIIAPTEKSKAWLENQLAANVKRAVSSVIGSTAEIEFKLDSG